MALLDRLRSRPTHGPGRTGQRALTAAAMVVQSGAQDDAPKPKVPKPQSWQGEAWAYYDEVGVLHYSAGYLGNCLSRVVLRPGFRATIDEETGPVYDDEGKVVEGVDPKLAELASAAIRALKSPVGGQSALLRAMGISTMVPAEFYLVGIDLRGAGGVLIDRTWEVLSTDELKPRAGSSRDSQKYDRHFPGSQPAALPDDSFVLRVWQPHPRYSLLADSSVRPLLADLELIRLATRAERSTLMSRLAGNGVYWVAEEIDFPADDQEGDDDDDPFTKDLIRTMSAPIENRDSPSAVVPLVARAPADYIERGIRYDRFDPPDDMANVLRLEAATKRFAQGIDLPQEVNTGMGSPNHWGAWQIDESTFKVYVLPPLDFLCDSLTRGYLWPSLMAALKVAGPLTPEVARFSVWYDASDLIVHPNREAAVDAAVGTGPSPSFVISMSAARRHKGFTEADAPDEDEVAERMEMAKALKGPAAAAAAVEPPGQDDNPEQGAPDVDKGPPPELNGQGDEAVPDSVAAALTARLAAGGELAVERAADRLGSKLRDKVRGRADLERTVKDVPSCEVANALGRTTVARLLPDGLPSTEFTAYRRIAQQWAEAMRHPNPEQLVDAVVGLVEQAARRRLHDRKAGLDLAEVRRAVLESAGAGEPAWAR